MRPVSMLIIVLFFFGAKVMAEDAGDSTAIRETARNYMESWYRGDAGQMKKCLAKQLAKRNVKQGHGDTRVIGTTSRADMLSYTRSGYGKTLWQDGLEIKVSILDLHDNIASVKVVTPHYYEYLHLAKTGERWQIINALYE